MEMATDLNGIMRKISALLSRADHEGTSKAEADACRAKAEVLMRKYRVEEEQLISETGEVLPMHREVSIFRYGTEFRYEMNWMWASVAQHCGIEFARQGYKTGEAEYTVTAVGYDVDLRLAEMIFTNARLVFGQHLEPEIDHSETDAENVYRLRSAGIDRQTIALRLWGHNGHQEGLKVGKLYKEECTRRGEDPSVSGRSTNAKTYRRLYAENFANQLSLRLMRARDAADSEHGAVVLANRAERVLEELYRLFPHRRPTPQPEPVETIVATPAKKKSRAVRPYRETKSAAERDYRDYHSPAAKAARRSARTAADSIRLDRPAAAKRAEGGRSAGQLEG